MTTETEETYRLTIDEEKAEALPMTELSFLCNYLAEKSESYNELALDTKSKEVRGHHFLLSQTYAHATELIGGILENRILDLIQIETPDYTKAIHAENERSFSELTGGNLD